MKVSKDAARTARRIFRLCAPNGQLNEDHIKQSFTKIIEDRPANFRQILHELQRLTRSDVESRIATIESATDLDITERTRIEENLKQQYSPSLSFTYSVDPALLGGVKMQVGDDVWDGSVKARLEKLTESL